MDAHQIPLLCRLCDQSLFNLHTHSTALRKAVLTGRVIRRRLGELFWQLTPPAVLTEGTTSIIGGGKECAEAQKCIPALEALYIYI